VIVSDDLPDVHSARFKIDARHIFLLYGLSPGTLA
jgi:hypothetical protein